MLLLFVASVLFSCNGLGIYTVLTNLNIYSHFPREIFTMFFNAFIGVFGLILYSLNIPVLGWDLISIEDAVNEKVTCKEYDNCQKYIDLYISTLNLLVWVSNARFITWYLEYVNTLFFILFFLKHPYISIILQYTLHTINFTLCIFCFVLVVIPNFPMLVVPYANVVSPIIIQSVVMFIVLYEYNTIYSSSLYSLKYTVHD
jgi:hypothetical protein